MSARRTILALALTGTALAGLGLHGWAIDGGRAAAFADRAVAEYGLALSAGGPATLRLLPLPRLTLDLVRVAAGRSGPMLAEDGRLTLDLDALALLAGRSAVGGLALDGARLSRDAAAWSVPMAALSGRLRAGIADHPFRIVVAGARFADGGSGENAARDHGAQDVAVGGIAGQDTAVEGIAVEVAWPRWGAAAEVAASLTWRGAPTRIALSGLRPLDLAAGRRSPFSAQADWPGGSLAADGTLVLPEGDRGPPALAGRARFETRSLPETLAWLGRSAPLVPLAGGLSLEGTFEGAGSSVAWPRLRLGIGGDVLEGAGAASLAQGEAGRLSLQATLAAETLNLGPVLGALVGLFEAEPVPLALAPLTRGDLDLRLSAVDGRAGPLRIEDLAASVLVRAGAVEVALNRARIQGGTLKGRVTLGSGQDPDETEVKAAASLDRVDPAGVLAEVGGGRWIQGPLQAQIALEGSARDSAALLARLGGRASLSIEGGAISGLDLADVVHRNGAVAPGALARRNGRTAFERAAVTLRFADGVGEIAEASLRGAAVGAALRGRISLPDRRIEAQADLSVRPPGGAARAVAFDISGPWEAPEVQALVRGEGDPARGATPLGLSGPPGPAGARAYAP